MARLAHGACAALSCRRWVPRSRFTGRRNPESWLAERSGTSIGAAKVTLEVERRHKRELAPVKQAITLDRGR